MARLRIIVVAQETDGDVYALATCKFYEPGTAAASGSSTSGTPFAGNLYAAISGGSPISTTQTLGSNGTLVVWTTSKSRVDVGIEPAGGGTAFVRQYEAAEFDPADVATLTGTETLTNKTLTTPAVTGPITFSGTAGVFESLPTALIDVGIGLNNLTDSTQMAASEIKGGGALTAASGRHANSYGTYAPVSVAYPMTAYMGYVTPDIADTSTSGGETSGNHTFALRRTGSGLLPSMPAGTTAAQAAAALTITAVSANSVTVSGLTTANTTDYVGWHFLVTSGAATSIARKVTAHTASATPTFTLDSGTSWGTTPSVSDTATLNYGQTIDYANVVSTFCDDSSIGSAGGVHTTKGFGTYGFNTQTSTGNVIGLFSLISTFSKHAVAVGAEVNPGNASSYASNYWSVVYPSSAGYLIGGTRANYSTYTVTAVNASPATAIQQLTTTWTVNEHVGKGVRITSGTQIGAERVVTANNGDTLTFTPSIPAAGLVGATFQLGSLWNGVALGIGVTGPDVNRLGAGWRHGILFDSYCFAEQGSFGIDFHPESDVAFPVRIPNGGALYAWRSGQTWAGTYSSANLLPATHPHAPLIGTLSGGNATYLGTDTTLVLADNSTGIFNTEIMRFSTAGLTFAAAAAVQTTTAAGITIKTNSTTRMEFGSGATIGVFGVTPAARASAYTLTYSTADKTHANPTSSALSGIASSTTGSALTEPDAAYVQATWQTNMRRIQDQYNALRTDVLDLKQLVNSVITDLQAYGWFQ